MKKFNQKSTGSRDFSKSRGGDRDRRFESNREGRPEMFKAVCADCGKSCEIPFKPNGNRPVYCSTCFSEHSGDGGDRSDFKRKEMFEATCGACGKKCEVPFKPVSGKPVFCSQCFDRDNGGRDRRDGGSRDHGSREGAHEHSVPAVRNFDLTTEQFNKLNTKLDMILSALESESVAKPKHDIFSLEANVEPKRVKTSDIKIIKPKKVETKVAVVKKAIVKKADKKKKK